MSDSYLPDNGPRDILLSLEELAAKKLPHAPTFRKAADEITTLRADIAAVTAERDSAVKAAYEDAARFIEENVFNYGSDDQYWSHRKGDNTHGLEYAREFRARAAIEGVKEP